MGHHHKKFANGLLVHVFEGLLNHIGWANIDPELNRRYIALKNRLHEIAGDGITIPTPSEAGSN